MPLGAFFYEDVHLVGFIYLAFTRTPGGVTVGDSGLYCCVPCLSSAIVSLGLLIGSGCVVYFPMLSFSSEYPTICGTDMLLMEELFTLPDLLHVCRPGMKGICHQTTLCASTS